MGAKLFRSWNRLYLAGVSFYLAGARTVCECHKQSKVQRVDKNQTRRSTRVEWSVLTHSDPTSDIVMASIVSGFHVVDYVIFGVILAVSLSIGLYHAFTGGKQRTTKEYFHGGGYLKTLPVALSILVSFVSAILVLGTPAEMYTRGTQLTLRVVGYCLAVTLSSLLFVPLFYRLKVTSSFEVWEIIKTLD